MQRVKHKTLYFRTEKGKKEEECLKDNGGKEKRSCQNGIVQKHIWQKSTDKKN